jgi:hypothetical protein
MVSTLSFFDLIAHDVNFRAVSACMGQLNFVPDVTQNFRKQFRDAAWRCQDDVAMDAATRSTSTPLGQVENPILNTFDSEYFWDLAKMFYDAHYHMNAV